jgi:hypothetical protein
MLLIVAPQKMNQSLVDYFFLPICVWMECCRPLEISVHILPQCSLEVIEKYGVPVEMILLCIPKCTRTYLKNKFVSSCPLMIFLEGMRMHILLNLSTTTNKFSCPFRMVGKPHTKSMDMLSQGIVGTGKGWYTP